MKWWHRAVLGHDQVTNYRRPVAWFPQDKTEYTVVTCSCGRKFYL